MGSSLCIPVFLLKSCSPHTQLHQGTKLGKAFLVLIALDYWGCSVMRLVPYGIKKENKLHPGKHWHSQEEKEEPGRAPQKHFYIPVPGPKLQLFLFLCLLLSPLLQTIGMLLSMPRHTLCWAHLLKPILKCSAHRGSRLQGREAFLLIQMHSSLNLYSDHKTCSPKSQCEPFTVY